MIRNPQRPMALVMFGLMLASIAGADDPKPGTTGAAFEKVIGLVESTIADPSDQAHALGQIAQGQAASGDREAARRTFARAIDLVDELKHGETRYSPHILAWIGEEQRRAGDLPGAFASYRKAVDLIDQPSKKESFKSDHYRNILSYQVRAGDLEGAGITLEKGRRYLARPIDDFNKKFGGVWTAQLLATALDFDGAFAAIAEDAARPTPLPQFKEDVLNAIARSVALAKPPGGEAILSRVMAMSATIKIPNQAPGPYLAVADAAAEIGDIPLAFEALREDQGLQAEAPAFMSATNQFNLVQVLARIAVAQAKAGQRDAARATLARASELAKGLPGDGSIRGGFLSIRTAWIEIGDYAEATRTHEGVPDQIVRFLPTIADAQEQAGDLVGARKTRERALAESQAEANLLDLRPDPAPAEGVRRQTWEQKKGYAESQVATCKAQLNDFAGALATARAIGDPQNRRSALSSVAGRQGRAGDIDEAAEWIGRLADPEARSSCVQSLASGLSARRMGTVLGDKAKP